MAEEINGEIEKIYMLQKIYGDLERLHHPQANRLGKVLGFGH